MFWQQKFFTSDPFSRPSRLGQAGGTCTLSPDGTTSCSTGTPPPVTPPVTPTVQAVVPVVPAQQNSNLIPIALGGVGLLALVVLLTR